MGNFGYREMIICSACAAGLMPPEEESISLLSMEETILPGGLNFE
jgi:hypothetical protein